MRVPLVLIITLLAFACSSTPPAAPPVDARPKSTGSGGSGHAGHRISPATARAIAMLDDPKEFDRALIQLVELGDPDAIPALDKAWEAQGRPTRIIAVVVSLAEPLSPDQAKIRNLTDYEATGRPASWDRALPLLTRAVGEVDDSNPRSVESAIKAAEALGNARLSGGVDPLIELAHKPVTKRSIAAYVAAVRALGWFTTDKPKIAAALVAIIGRDSPPHPRTATDPTDRRALEDAYALYLGTEGAALNALAELRPAGIAKPLVLAMYRVPELFTQTRRALVAAGPSAEKELVSALRGDNADVTKLFKDHKLDMWCDRGASCQPVAAKDFYAAVVLGDFYDPTVVPDLLAALNRPPLPVYYEDDVPSPNTQRNAIFDALRKIGSPAAGPQVRAAWLTPGGDLQTRILAVGAYPFITRDAADAEELGKIAADNAADDGLRTEAATAFARLARDPKDIALLQQLAKRYVDASAKKTREADPLRRRAAAADKALADKRAALDKLLAESRDTATKTPAQIRATTAALTKAEADFRTAKTAHKTAVGPFKALDSAAKAYHGFARMFQTHVARIEIAIRCNQDAACLAASLAAKPDEVAASVASYLPDVKSWTDDEKLGLVEGAVERAMLEVGKLGDKASSLTDRLLDASASDNRAIRKSVLLALPRIAKLPCPQCEAKLEAARRAGEGKTSLADLAVETTVLRNYFSWAGSRPSP